MLPRVPNSDLHNGLHFAQQKLVHRNNHGHGDLSSLLGIRSDDCSRLPSMEIGVRHSDTTATIRTFGEGVAFCEKYATGLSH
jgi:hypothetical protein